jgi:hypothetical protein
VDQPSFLMAFKQAVGSGPNVVNSGTNPGQYAFASQGAQGTDYTFSATGGQYGNGYVTVVGGLSGDTHMPYLSTTATAPSATLETINCAIGFRITQFFNGQFMLVKPGTATAAGGASISGGTPAAGGDFDLQVVEFENSGSTILAMPTLPTALTFGVDYVMSMSINVTTPSSSVASFKFGSNSVQTATGNFATFTWEGAWPFFLRRSDFTDTFAPSGRINFIAFQRGGNPWSSADLAAINSDPTQIPGWPIAPTVLGMPRGISPNIY